MIFDVQLVGFTFARQTFSDLLICGVFHPIMPFIMKVVGCIFLCAVAVFPGGSFLINPNHQKFLLMLSNSIGIQLYLAILAASCLH